jgi:hypothetical protein
MFDTTRVIKGKSNCRYQKSMSDSSRKILVSFHSCISKADVRQHFGHGAKFPILHLTLKCLHSFQTFQHHNHGFICRKSGSLYWMQLSKGYASTPCSFNAKNTPPPFKATQENSPPTEYKAATSLTPQLHPSKQRKNEKAPQ